MNCKCCGQENCACSKDESATDCSTQTKCCPKKKCCMMSIFVLVALIAGGIGYMIKGSCMCNQTTQQAK